MLTAVQVKPDVYWVGGVDWNARSFHGYTTEDGITYNAYLIMDEKVTLIDTAKSTFKDEFLQRISAIVDPSKIDVLICNHVEMDHSGNIPTIKELAPNAQIYCSPQAVKELTAHYGDLGYTPVKTGDTLSIGKRTLAFVQTPMVHWPDNMVTLDVEDKILFSNDAFGQHFASSARFDDENDYHEIMKQARKYYANIVQPYRMQAANAVKAVRKLGPDAIDMIAPAHGVIWRSHVAEILVAAQLMDLKENHVSDAMDFFLDAKYVAVGSPTLNSNMMPTVAGFLTYMRGLSPKPNNTDRIGFAFGSYGWAPLGPKNVYAELEADGFQLPEPAFMYNWIPTQEYLDGVREKVRAVVKANPVA